MQKHCAKYLFKEAAFSFFLRELTPNKKETWEELLISADNDFVSFMFLSCCGIAINTSSWMSIHSLEKYLKSYLLKTKESYDTKKDQHDLSALWKSFVSASKWKYSSALSSHHLYWGEYYDKFINDLSLKGKNANIRYNIFNFYVNMIPFYCLYNEIAYFLRKKIIGDEFDKRGVYGIPDCSFGGLSDCFSEKNNIEVKRYVLDYIEKIFYYNKTFYEFNEMVDQFGGRRKYINYMKCFEEIINILKRNENPSYNPKKDFVFIVNYFAKNEANINQVIEEIKDKFKTDEFDQASRFIKKVVAQLGGLTNFDKFLPCIFVSCLCLTPRASV